MHKQCSQAIFFWALSAATVLSRLDKEYHQARRNRQNARRGRKQSDGCGVQRGADGGDPADDFGSGSSCLQQSTTFCRSSDSSRCPKLPRWVSVNVWRVHTGEAWSGSQGSKVKLARARKSCQLPLGLSRGWAIPPEGLGNSNSVGGTHHWGRLCSWQQSM